MNAIRYTTILIGLIASLSSIAQELSFKHYTVNDGLPSSEVYCATQDSKGYMWFGTDRGVARYDGYQFKTFTTVDGLGDNTVFKILDDKKGTMWFNCYNGKLTSRIRDKFIIQKGIFGYNISISIGLDSKSNLWIRPYDSKPYFTKIDSSGNRDSVSHPKTNMENDDPLLFIQEIDSLNYLSGNICPRNITLQIGSNKKRYFSYYLKYKSIDGTEQLFSIEQNIPATKYTYRNPCTINRLNKNEYIITYYSSIYHLNLKRKILKKYPLKHCSGLALLLDKTSNLWIADSLGGVDHYSFKNRGNGINISYEGNYLSNKIVTEISQDLEGGIWFTTLNDGVYYLSSTTIKNYAFENEKVTALEISDDCIYFSTPENFLHKLNRKKHISRVSNTKYINANVSTIFKDPFQNILCSFDNKSELYNLKTNSQFGPTTRFLTNAKQLIFANGLYWGVNHTGLFSYDNKSKIINRYFLKYRIFSLCYSDSFFWFGAIDGLYKCRSTELNDEHILKEPLSCRISYLKQIKESLWIGTRGNGLFIRTFNGKYLSLTEKDGLASNFCNHICSGGKDTVFIATNKGISMITKKGNSYKLNAISVSDGLPSNEINQLLYSNDTLWVGSNAGLSFLNIHHFLRESRQLNTYITNISINGRDTSLLKNYLLSHDKNSIDFSFVSISFKNAGKIKYRYKLIGLDTSWKYTSQTTISYNFLNPGNYSFFVQPENFDGSWSKHFLSIPFTIYPPYWETWWFRSLIALSSILVIAFIFRIRERNKATIELLVNNLNKSKQQALNAQIDPHFIFNSLNSIQNYILNQDKRVAAKYLTRFSLLMRRILEQSQQDCIPVKDEIYSLRLYVELEQLRFKDKFTFEIILENEAFVTSAILPTMVIQPFVENAILHGLVPKEGKGKLILRFKLIGDFLHCTILDDGVGIDNSRKNPLKLNREHESVGMSITEQRILLLNSLTKNSAHISVKQLPEKDGGGTQIDLSFNQKQLKND